jgi:hypothetical protein
MGRSQVKYSQEELNRPQKYFIVCCDRNIDTSIIDIEEARAYVKQYGRRAIIVSNKTIFKGDELPMIKYNFIMNATTPALRLIDHCGDSYKIVFKYLNSNFKNGLVIAHEDVITNEIADMLAKNKGNGLDIMVYRPDLTQLSGEERHAMNFIRFHANSEFIFSKDNYRHFVEKLGENIAIGVFTCQMIANYNYRITQVYFEENSAKYTKLGHKDFVDYNELTRQMAYCVYYDTMRAKIIGFNLDKVTFYIRLMFGSIKDKVMENRAGELAAIYTEV